MNMFEEIDKLKKDLPKAKTISKEMNDIELNIYQKISVVIFIICVLLGVLLSIIINMLIILYDRKGYKSFKFY